MEGSVRGETGETKRARSFRPFLFAVAELYLC